ncbi:hypothetical protein BCV72DRAFT_265615 [Rhizopus microsporus var. microsporus]|uniref:Uncharacterized protein n=1 Tax=Rhizopus microsporus var. microsporus TaxID=86635 RepID=A0A1X0QPR2_RHIZD|nr:hypothetical protein BCV72DRAFT_265615 [Rhizopus microsporus var. microsporus]
MSSTETTLQHFCKLLQKIPTLPVSELWSPWWYLGLLLRCVVQPITPAEQDAMPKNVPLRCIVSDLCKWDKTFGCLTPLPNNRSSSTALRAIRKGLFPSRRTVHATL